MKTISRYIMTLALLLTAVTGAWAQSTLNVVELKVPAAWEGDNSNMTTADLTGFKASTLDEAKAWTGAPTTGSVYLIYSFDGENASYVYFDEGKYAGYNSLILSKALIFGTSNCKFYYTASDAIDVEWNASTKTGTFEMPAFDVEIAPIYAPTAVFDTKDSKVLAPTAAEGIYAESTDSIVTPGTVAKIGETENLQGTLMYAVSTSATEQPAPTAFSATLPTAKDITTAGDVYVWYYIKGADTPEGQEATAENTFNDSEICETPLTVTVLSNKFDIQFNAANANTIDATEASKGTVTLGGTAATVTEGKLEGVKMGSEVKVKANTGYKFRKVELKKKEAAKPLANATTEDLGKVVGADGNIYANKDAAEAVATGNAVAMICYVNEGHGLALALSDISSYGNSWDNSSTNNGGKTAAELCSAWNTSKAVTGATWKLASLSEMKQMINAAGNYAALRDGFSAVGGTNMSDDYYWVSDESSADYAKNINFGDGYDSQEFKNDSYQVRACLEW